MRKAMMNYGNEPGGESKKMKKIAMAIFLAMAFWGNQSNAYATPILDASNTAITWQLNGGEQELEWQQRLMATHAGTLVGIDLYFLDPGSIRLFVNKGVGWQTDQDDFSSIMTATQEGWNSFDVSSALIPLVMGEQYNVGFAGIGPSGNGDEVWLAGSGGAEPLLYKFASMPVTEAMPSLSFRTYIDDMFISPPSTPPVAPAHTPTPEPGSIWLLFSGLSGVAFLKQRKRYAAGRRKTKWMQSQSV